MERQKPRLPVVWAIRRQISHAADLPERTRLPDFAVQSTKQNDAHPCLVWQEGKAPDAIIELASQSTRKEETGKKFKIYRDILKVREYFLFDPRGDYLDPKFQGYRLLRGEYVPIAPVAGRLPSLVLGLYLEGNGVDLRFWDPKTDDWLPTLQEKMQRERAHRAHAETAVERVEKGFREVRAELDALKRKIGKE